MILTKTKRAAIIEKLESWLESNQFGYYIYVEDFEDIITDIMKSLDLDSYSNTRYFCKSWLESHDHALDLSKSFA